MIIEVVYLYSGSYRAKLDDRTTTPVEIPSKTSVTLNDAITRQENSLARVGIDVLRIRVEGKTVRIIAAWTRPLVLRTIDANAITIHLRGELGLTRVEMGWSGRSALGVRES